LCNSLCDYHSLLYLQLDNNDLGCRGAAHLAAVLPSTKVRLLDVGFNKIGAQGMASLMAAVSLHPTLEALTLSGNKLDLDGSHSVASGLNRTRNKVLRELYLDHTELSQLGQCQIATEVVNNRDLALTKLTGFPLGLIFAQVRVPALSHHAQAVHSRALRLQGESQLQTTAASDPSEEPENDPPPMINSHSSPSSASSSSSSSSRRSGGGVGRVFRKRR